ncbi:hypothetical protein D3C80_2197590 [compost metagenome]
MDLSCSGCLKQPFDRLRANGVRFRANGVRLWASSARAWIARGERLEPGCVKPPG